MSDAPNRKFLDRLTYILPAVIALSLSMYLFLHLARQESARLYPLLQLQKVESQGEFVRQTMERFFKAGVALRDFAGFEVLTEQQLDLDPILQEIAVTDLDGQVLFRNGRFEDGVSRGYADTQSLGATGEGTLFSVSEDQGAYRVTLPLHNKFEQVGTLVLSASKGRILEQAQAKFASTLIYFAGLLLLFVVVVYLSRSWIGEHTKARMGVTLVLYLSTLVGAAYIVNQGLMELYAEGVLARNEAVSLTLAERFQSAMDLGLELEDFAELDRDLSFLESQQGDIDYIAMVAGNTVRLHSDPSRIGEPPQRLLTHHEARTALKRADGTNFGEIVVGVPLKKIRDRYRSIVGQYAAILSIIVLFSALFFVLVDYYLIIGFRTLKVPAVFVLSLSFVLLYYVGLGEAFRSYPKLELEKLAAQGETVRQAMEGFLKAGVPLRQYVGFNTLTQPILTADKEIKGIQVYDNQGGLVFSNSNPFEGSDQPRILAESAETQFTAVEGDGAGEGQTFLESSGYYRVSLSLSNKFEKVGDLVLTLPNTVINARVNAGFRSLAIWLGVVIALFAATLFVVDRFFTMGRRGFLNISYGIAFLLASGLVVGTLVSLYTYGIEGKTRALSISLAKRLESATALGLPLETFSGIDGTFSDYKDRNPELSVIALSRNGVYDIHLDPERKGESQQVQDDTFEFGSSLAGVGDEVLALTVGIPKRIVYARLWRSIKNFLVLFIATGLLASLFLNLISTLNKAKEMDAAETKTDEESRHEIELVLIKILYFIVVFVEGLFASFLPLYLQEMTEASGFDAGKASLLFTAFFAAFAASLIPSGNYAEKKGVKFLMVLGMLLTTISAYLITLFSDFYALMLLRILAGIGQGMVFIGVQSFILHITSKGKTTQGTSIIVYGYNTGMISGTAIGALLVTYMGPGLVFKLGAMIGLFSVAFIFFLIPDVRKPDRGEAQAGSRMDALRAYFAKLGVLFRDFQFIKTIFLVGLTTKGTLTGIIIYALPLVMARQGYPQDDIGQVLMFYAAGVLFTNVYVPRLADKMGNTSKILLWGALGSGLGLICVGLIDWSVINSGIPFLRTAVLITGVFILGIAHGFIHAPIVTHIAYTEAAGVLGKATTTSIYRFLERIGHVLGPIIIGYLLVLRSYGADTFSLVGAVLAVFGLIFFILRLPTRRVQAQATGG